MPIRYSDLDPAISGTADFVVRNRNPSISRVGLVFLSILFFCIGCSVMVDNHIVLLALLFLTLSVAGWYVIMNIQRNRDLVLATEFQNAMFASALGINNKFCMIVKRDGNIVYIDRAFQDVFPDFLKQTHRTVSALLQEGSVSAIESRKIHTAIEQGVFAKVIFAIKGSSGAVNKIVMSVEPIVRPQGFILLRGREFIETRETAQTPEGFKTPDLLNRSNTTLFSYVMDSMDMGVYMTGPTGSIVYVNPVLEHWLGYETDEIISSNLSLQDILHNIDAGSTPMLKDFAGEISLSKKLGGLHRVFINQKIIRDEVGKALGYTALLHNMPQPLSDEEKKQLW